ncbi:uncharacterized protein [Halyomorpha halys]|uniref:uncharacterized protein isoform X2 n=1 Tax=Halyomorpha halys TaxID=286706 RepID=UPI0006D4D0B8|nr:uncharacterized protein LOC106687730 isoform X2 [Halyomorpha halys]
MDVRLIEEVCRWPILYNTSCKEYKNLEMKNHAWVEITTNLFGSYNPIIVEKVKNKWKNLRDTFVKSLRKKDRPNSKQWKHEEQMRFLLPHIATKVPFTHHNEETLDLSLEKMSRSSSPEELPSENSWEVDLIKKENNSKEQMELPVEAVMEESPSRRQANNLKRRRKDSFNSPMAVGVHFMDNSEHLLEQMSCSSLPFDSVDYFFLAVASSVKRMRPTNQINLKRAITNLVYDTELSEIEDRNNVASSSS